MISNYTPGPWRWEINFKHKNLALVGGKPMFDATVLEPVRWGMGSATVMFRAESKLYKVHERPEWSGPFTDRAHHAEWCSALLHPDALLIQAAPRLADTLLRIASAPALTIDQAKAMALETLVQASQEWPVNIKV